MYSVETKRRAVSLQVAAADFRVLLVGDSGKMRKYKQTCAPVSHLESRHRSMCHEHHPNPGAGTRQHNSRQRLIG